MTVDGSAKLSEKSRKSIQPTNMGKNVKIPQAFVCNFEVNENALITEKYPRKITTALDRPRNPSFVRSLEFAKRKITETGKADTRKEEVDCKEDLLSAVRLIFDEANLPENFAEWSYDEQRNWTMEKGGKELLSLPDSLLFVIPSMSRPGDCGRASTDKPDWLDVHKFRRGQRFAMDHWSGICFANFLSLFLLFSFEDGLKPMILTHQSHTPYLAFKRYLSTVHRVRNWYSYDPWTEGTAAYKDIQSVRRMHQSIRQRIRNSKPEEIDAMSEISNPWCPMFNSIKHDFRSACPIETDRMNPYKILLNAPWRPKALNQGEMAGTQFAFMGMALLYPRAFGIHYSTEEDLESFCHFWKGIGYLLGMEDEYNFGSGTLKEVKQRAQDYIDICVKSNLRDITPVWEHMCRCAIEGTNYFLLWTSFSMSLLYVTHIFGIAMPAFYSKVGLFTRVLFMVTKFFFYHMAKFTPILALFNKLVNRGMDKAIDFTPQLHSTLQEKSAKALLNFSID